MHSLIYFGFLGLFIATVILELNHQLPGSWQFLHGDTYKAYSAGADLAGVVFLVGIVLGRRCAATSNGRTASASRRSPKTP